MSRIPTKFKEFKAAGRTGLIAGVTVGFPSVEATLEIVPAIVAAGVDMVELCVPFSDPLADGATIQRSSHAALQQGVTLQSCLDVAATLREQLPTTPLLFMGYFNPILKMGVEKFVEESERAGADGLIVPDLPPEEATVLLKACQARGIDVVFLASPTSTEERLEKVARSSSGFVYCVSLTGVTGARTQVGSGLPAFLARMREHTKLPLAVGFGISEAQHVRSVGEHAEAVIVASALVNAIEAGGRSGYVASATRFIAKLREGTLAEARS